MSRRPIIIAPAPQPKPLLWRIRISRSRSFVHDEDISWWRRLLIRWAGWKIEPYKP